MTRPTNYFAFQEYEAEAARREELAERRARFMPAPDLGMVYRFLESYNTLLETIRDARRCARMLHDVAELPPGAEQVVTRHWPWLMEKEDEPDE